MTKRIIVIISSVIVMIFLALIIQAALKPRPFNWNPSYSSYDKQPYGAYIIFSEIKNLFPGKKVKRFGPDDFKEYYLFVNTPVGDDVPFVYEEEPEDAYDWQSDSSLWYDEEGNFLLDTMDVYEEEDYVIPEYGEEDIGYSYEYEDSTWAYDDTYEDSAGAYYDYEYDTALELFELAFDSTYLPSFNVVMIADYFSCDELNARALLLHAYQGNDVFIAASDINEYLSAFLGLETAWDSVDTEEKYSDAFVIAAHDHLPVQLSSYGYYAHFTSYPDSASAIASNKRDQVLGVKVKVGEGTVTYFTLPIVFTNYYLLKDDNSIAENLLLDLPNQDTYWGNRIIGSRAFEDQESLLSFIHSQESLTWAFYTIVVSMLGLFVFQIKRKQRIIPMMAKPENDSLRFVEVISNLYLLNKDNKSLLQKKMIYFLEMIRSKYHLNTSVIDEAFFTQLAIKSKVSIKHIKKIFRDYDILIGQKTLQNPELLHFNKMIQHFKHKK
jgi:hypothetical protein